MKWKVSLLSALVIAALIVSGFTFLSPSVIKTVINAPATAGINHAVSLNKASTSTSGMGANMASGMRDSKPSVSPFVNQALKDGLPLKYLYIPALNHRPVIKDGVVLPGYVQSPAPMGIGAYGIMNESGVLVPITYTTTGFNATINLTTLQPFLLSNYAPSSVSIQLNAVLNNVTLFGSPTYAFWTQNVLFYSARQHYIEFVDNIWNFSSPAILMSSNAIYSHTAVRYPYPYAYIGVGPIIPNASTPMNINLVLNSAVVGGMDTVFFNYTVQYTNISSGKPVMISGIFDEVQFNSSNGLLGYSAPLSRYLVTGSYVTPTGFIPWDAEIMIGGPGGGSSTDIYAINGTMGLSYLNSTGKYVTVPSAYDIGSETGETSTGIAEAWTPQGTVYLTAGPSLVEGMWGINSYSGLQTYKGTVSPSNAFMFVSQGTALNMSNNGWVPLTTAGGYDFTLEAGLYYAQTMLSGYMWNDTVLPPNVTKIVLTKDASVGIYTPLYAWNNAQLANISTSGNGGSASPYMIMNSTHVSISPLFANMNDYGFQVFSGVLLANISAHTDLMNMPELLTEYQMLQPEIYALFYRLPLVDSLGYVLYSTSNVSIYGASLVTGDLASYTVAGFDDANMMVWNSTHDLIASSVFSSENAISLLVYNPSNVMADNVIWGNWFMNTTSYGAFSFGLYLASSGNLIFNNYFGRPAGTNVLTPTFDPYTSAPVIYKDTWNITREPSTFKYSFNGLNLTGSIVNTNYVGGNYWDDYKPGTRLPFNESGNIVSGGDYLPLVITNGYYPIVIVADNLPTGTSWWVDMSGYTKTSTSSVILFYGQNRSYSLQTGASNYYGYLGFNVQTVSININGSGYATGVQFLEEYTLTLTETNLPPGFVWVAAAVPVGPGELSYTATNAATVMLPVTIGEYYVLYGAYGYYFPQFNESQEYGTSSVQMVITGNTSLTVMLPPLTNTVILQENGLSSGTTWYADVSMLLNSGQQYFVGNFSSASTMLEIPLVAAPYTVTLYAPGYMATPQSFQFTVYPNSYSTFLVQFVKEFQVTMFELGLPSGTQWSVSIIGTVTASASTSSSSLMLTLPMGAYEYTASSSNADYAAASGVFVVSNAASTIYVFFSPTPAARFSVTFTENGLASGTTWQVTFNGQTISTTSSSVTFTVAPGSYYYSVYSNGSVSTDGSGFLNVQSSMNVSVTFVPQSYSVTFIAQGLPSGVSWSLVFNGKSISTTDPVVILTIPAGQYTYSVSAPGYTISTNTSVLKVGSNTIVLLQFHPSVVKRAVTTSALTGPLFDALFLIIGLIVGAVIVFAYYRVRMQRQSKK